jgi:hypothetical protein
MNHNIKYMLDVLSDRIYVQNEANFVVKNDLKQTEINLFIL